MSSLTWLLQSVQAGDRTVDTAFVLAAALQSFCGSLLSRGEFERANWLWNKAVTLYLDDEETSVALAPLLC